MGHAHFFAEPHVIFEVEKTIITILDIPPVFSTKNGQAH
jgi:hypothetical protein